MHLSGPTGGCRGFPIGQADRLLPELSEVGVSGGGAPTLLRTSQLPFVGTRLV